MLKENDICSRLSEIAEEMGHTYKRLLVKKPRTREDKRLNKRVYNMKCIAIRRALRDHLKELQLTPDQHEFLGGHIRVSNGEQTYNASIYSSEERRERYQKEKVGYRRAPDKLASTMEYVKIMESGEENGRKKCEE